MTKAAPKTRVRKVPTRREKAIALMAKGGSEAQALRKAGYSEAYARNPQKFRETDAYNDLIEKFLPDEMLLETHSRIVNSPRVKRTFMKGAMIEEVEETDPSQVRGLDMAYKLKGKYQGDGVTNNVLIVNVSRESSQRYGAVHNSDENDQAALQ